MRNDQKKYPAYTDTDTMIFGKHRGEPLSDIPASYFRWLWTEGGIKDYLGSKSNSNNTRLANYIWNSQDALAQELGDTFI
jgi:hypothetical protein